MKKIDSSICIHQPHYFAWVPHYAKIACSEIYFVLDELTYRRHYFHDRCKFQDNRGGITRVNTQVRGSQNTILREAELLNLDYTTKKFMKSISNCYSKSPYYKLYIDKIINFLNENRKNQSLMNYNLNFTQFIFSELNLNMPVIKYMSEFSISDERNERLIEICKTVDKEFILAGWGSSKSVHDIKLLEKNNVFILNSSPNVFLPEHSQMIENSLSIIDTLFKFGPDRICELILMTSKAYENDQN